VYFLEPFIVCIYIFGQLFLLIITTFVIDVYIIGKGYKRKRKSFYRD